jgi:hypothetical protein
MCLCNVGCSRASLIHAIDHDAPIHAHNVTHRRDETTLTLRQKFDLARGQQGPALTSSVSSEFLLYLSLWSRVSLTYRQYYRVTEAIASFVSCLCAQKSMFRSLYRNVGLRLDNDLP